MTRETAVNTLSPPSPGEAAGAPPVVPPAASEALLSSWGARERRVKGHSRWFRRTLLATMVLVLLAAGLRVALIPWQGLWVDEGFSLAAATGHSLEQPAAVADPSKGDYIERPQAVPPAVYADYLKHTDPAAGWSRLRRAELLSDTHPPLYYLLLNFWTRGLGTSDMALRLFSVFWGLATLVVLWDLARRIGGNRAAFVAAALFAFAPLGVFYSTQGRMYSMLWFFTLFTAWATWRWRQVGESAKEASTAALRDGSFRFFLLWVLASAGGLLTHYFFLFPWAACGLWLLLHLPRPRGGVVEGAAGARPVVLRRLTVIAAGIAAAALVAPWYVHLPHSLRVWRVTRNWQASMPGGHPFLLAPFKLAAGWFAGGPGAGWAHWPALAAAGAVGLIVLWRVGRGGRMGRGWFTPRLQLLWLWVLATLAGPVLFDLLRGTYTADTARYAIAGMPAAFVLLAYGLSRFPRRVGGVMLILVLAGWVPGLGRLYLQPARADEPFEQIGRRLAKHTGAGDVVIVHSIPSGVVTLARYMEQGAASPTGVKVAAWTGQLDLRRVPVAMPRLAAGRRRVILVIIHPAGAPAREKGWLEHHARRRWGRQQGAAWIGAYVPRRGSVFPGEARAGARTARRSVVPRVQSAHVRATAPAADLKLEIVPER